MAQTLVKWREWDESAFVDAAAQDKPVLLGISAVWCHWCHVMDRGVPGDQTHTGVYTNPEIADYINQNFIPVRVDNDQRPDINARYNMGGWPTTCFLTPAGDVIYGGTYFAPSQMRNIMPQVLDYWHNRRDEVTKMIEERNPTTDDRRSTTDEAASPAVGGGRSSIVSDLPTTDIVSNIANQIIRGYDKRNGGLGDGQKFPMSDAWALCLAVYAQTREERLLEMVAQTFLAMGTRGMYDLVAGGFFRYSTTPDWTVPHFEKMLEDHSRLLPVYLHAIQVARNREQTKPLAEKLAAIVRSALGYLCNELLYDKFGLTFFAGSQDADEDYYLLGKAERAAKIAPFIDWRVYVDWNALIVSALFLASDVLAEIEYAQLGEKVLNTLVRLCLNPDGSITHSIVIDFDKLAAGDIQIALKPAALRGQLGDQAVMLKVLLEQHLRSEQAGRLYGQSRLKLAQWVLDFTLRELGASDGGFYDSLQKPGALGMLKVRLKPIFDNSSMAEALLMMAQMDDRPPPSILSPHSAYLARARACARARARATLAHFIDEYPRYREHGSAYAMAVMKASEEPVEVMIIDGDATWLQAAQTAYHPWRLIRMLDTKTDAAFIAARGYPIDRLPVAFVCKGTTCGAPVYAPELLKTV